MSDQSRHQATSSSIESLVRTAGSRTLASSSSWSHSRTTDRVLRCLLDQTDIAVEVGAESVQRLLPRRCTLLLGEFVGILILPGGVVVVAEPPFLGKPRPFTEGVGFEARRGGISSTVGLLTRPGQGWLFHGVAGN